MRVFEPLTPAYKGVGWPHYPFISVDANLPKIGFNYLIYKDIVSSIHADTAACWTATNPGRAASATRQ
jgi:hypothetical protein